MSRCVAVIASSVAAGPAWAHPGHGVFPASVPAHWLFDAPHLLALPLLIGAVGVAWRLRKRQEVRCARRQGRNA